MKISFRAKKISLLYDMYLNNLTINEMNHKIMVDKIYVLTIKEIQEVENIFENIEQLQDSISKYLSSWKWQDLRPIEKSILLNGVYEIDFLEKEKKIVINEFVKYSKSLGSNDMSYKLINAVLDNFQNK